MPPPVLNASAIRSRAITPATIVSIPPTTNAGESSSTNTSACSGVRLYVPLAGSYSAYPRAAWFTSHGLT